MRVLPFPTSPAAAVRLAERATEQAAERHAMAEQSIAAAEALAARYTRATYCHDFKRSAGYDAQRERRHYVGAAMREVSASFAALQAAQRAERIARDVAEAQAFYLSESLFDDARFVSDMLAAD